MEMLDRYLGARFSEAKFEKMDSFANRDYNLLKSLTRIREEMRNNGAGSGSQRFKLLRQILRKWNRKIKSMAAKILPRRRGSHGTHPHPPENETGNENELTEQPGYSETGIQEDGGAFGTELAIEDEEEYLLDQNRGTYESSPYRYKHKLPCEETRPEVRSGLVNKLAIQIAEEKKEDWGVCITFDDTPRRYRHRLPCEEEGTHVRPGFVFELAHIIAPLLGAKPGFGTESSVSHEEVTPCERESRKLVSAEATVSVSRLSKLCCSQSTEQLYPQGHSGNFRKMVALFEDGIFAH